DAGAEPAEADVEESELVTAVRELVERVVGGLGVRCRIDVAENEEGLTVSCAGGDLGLLIGKRGQTIDAIQYLANAIGHRRFGTEAKPVVIDAAHYRERRTATLEGLALRAAERVRDASEPVELEPMSAVERKVVHLRLQDEPGIETES